MNYMNPVAFNILGLEIRWYGILIAFGMLLGIKIAMIQAKKNSIKEESILDIVLWAIPASIIGARIYYVIFNWQYYKFDFFKIINTRLGGMAIHGGLIGGVLAIHFICKFKKLDFIKMLDIIVVGLPLGQAIGRWGNFINKEAHGGPTNLPWGIIVDGQKVHPTFLYESIWDFALFMFLLHISKKKEYKGQVFVLYAIIYSVGRFFIEGLRTDSLMIGPIRTAQLISLGSIIVGCLLHFYWKKKNRV